MQLANGKDVKKLNSRDVEGVAEAAGRAKKGLVRELGFGCLRCKRQS